MKRIEELIKKYWEGNSELEEEELLKGYFAHNKSEKLEEVYFNFISHSKEEKLNDPDFDAGILRKIDKKEGRKRSIFQMINWRVAAAIIVLFTASIIFFSRKPETQVDKSGSENLVTMDTYDDPEKAFEETKKALLFISNKMKKGNEYALEFGKFSESQENLKKTTGLDTLKMKDHKDK